jgi:hypothetical protein
MTKFKIGFFNASANPVAGKAKAMESMSRAARLRALKRLLDYALVESKDLGLTHLDHLVGAAALAVGEELDNVGVLSPRSAASGRSPLES